MVKLGFLVSHLLLCSRIHFITFFTEFFSFLCICITVLSQLQQELSYRFLHANSQVNHSNHQQHQHQQPQHVQQQQHGFKHPGQQQPVRRGDSGQAMDTSVAPSPAVGGVSGGRQQYQHQQQQQRPQGFKWCYAHVHIAQQIQQQQQRAKVSPGTLEL